MKTKTMLFAFLGILALCLVLLAMGSPAKAGTSIEDNTTRQAERNLFEAISKSLDRPILQVNATVNSPDLSYNSWVTNSSGTAAAQRIPYVIDGRVYDMTNGTVDLSAVNTWTTMRNNTTCYVAVYVDANGVVNATQGELYAATAAGNTTRAAEGWPETPHGVAVIAGLLLYSPPTSQLTIGTTALTQGTNAWAYGLNGNPRYALTQ
jgi:hypothetical protein